MKYKYVVTVSNGSDVVQFKFDSPIKATAFADICMDGIVKAERAYRKVGVTTEIINDEPVKKDEPKDNEKESE